VIEFHFQRLMPHVVDILHGTLIIAVPTKSGLVVCADKKMLITGARSRLLDVVKIKQLGSHAAFGLSGNPVFYDPSNGRQLFSAEDVVRRFYSDKELRLIKDTWRKFVPALQQEFTRFLSGLTAAEAPPSGPAPSYFLFHLPFWYVDADGEFGTTTISIKYIKEQGMVQGFCLPESAAAFQVGRAFAWGSVEVFDELRTGRDPRFESFRSDPQIKRLVNDSPPVNEVEAEEAAIVLKRIIKFSSENLTLLAPNKLDVGSTTDCALISKTDGFKWLPQDEAVVASKVPSRSSQVRKKKTRWKTKKRK
jgi:hypothetical protein